MSTVYLAEDLALGRGVALKLLSPALSKTERFQQRFRVESRLAASIDHPNVIPIYEAGQAEDGTLFIAMRYVDGADLRRVLRDEGALDTQRAVELLAQVAEGLDQAHARGLVHRDVKPSNVLIARSDTGSEHAYLADFGLTKTSTTEADARESITLSGSSDYVSPEQIRGEASEKSCDIYAFGCVAYECLTGEVPFKRPGELEVLFAHMTDEPPRPSAANHRLPGEVDQVIGKAMAKRPGDRYRSGTELVDALRSATSPQRQPSRRRLAFLGVLLAIVVAASVVPALVLTGGGSATAVLEPGAPDRSVIETIAGTGTRDFGGDGGPAVEADLDEPRGLAFDAGGNLYIADAGNNRIRIVDPNGVITTIAGNGEPGSTGDGGPASEATLSHPTASAFDAAGNFYFADRNANRVRRIDVDGTITTVTGSGALGQPARGADEGTATEAQLAVPVGIAVDAEGTLYVSDLHHHRILRVGTDGRYTTFAGTGAPGFSGDGGPATEAELFLPSALAVGPGGSVYVYDGSNFRIRRIGPDGIITTVTGNGIRGFSGDGGPAVEASINDGRSLVLDAEQNLYFTDTAADLTRRGDDFGNRVRRVDRSGIISTVAGTGRAGFAGDGGPATKAHMDGPSGLAFDADGNLYISDHDNSRVRRVTFNR